MEKPKIPLVVIILAIALIIGGLVFVLKYSNQKALLGTKYEENLKDSDNDGLKDWEEELYKTDMNNPDTDGDGYVDGEEVNSGHNPVVKAPGDKLTLYPLPLGEKYNITKKVLSEEFIGSILDSYLAQKGEYIDDHPEIDSQETFVALIKQSTLEEMSNRAFGDSYPILLEKAEETIEEIPGIFNLEITDENIKISEDNSSEAIKLYLSQIFSILNSDTFLLHKQSFDTLISALQNNDFVQLDQTIKQNDNKIEELKNMVVPSSWKEIHKETLRLTLLIRNIFVSFRDVQDDPLKAYVAVEKLESFPDAWNNLRNKILTLAEDQGMDI